MNKKQSPMTNALIKSLEEHNNRLPYNGGIIAYRDEQKIMANGKEIINENGNIYFVDTTGEKYALENCTYGCVKNALKMVTDAFTQRAKLVRFEITSRVIVESMYNDEMAIQRAIDKITKNPEGYLCFDNVVSVEDDTEMPYNPEYDTPSIKDVLGHYTYQVEECCGQKELHIDGYVYWNGDHYDIVQACGCIISVDVLKARTGEEIKNYIDNVFDNSKQYSGEISEEEIMSYYNPEKNKYLGFSQINENTPCGFYRD